MKLDEDVKRFIRDTEFTPIVTSGEDGAHLVSTWGGEGKDGGQAFRRIKRKFPWARAAVVLEVQKYEKLLPERRKET